MANRKVTGTSDYKKFKFYKENRDVNQKHLTKLIANIERRNLLVDMPILVDEDFYVIDGQTRLEAARALKLPIYYTKAQKAQRKDIAVLNIQSKTWDIGDWLKHYCALKNINYLKFREFIKKHDLTIPNGLIFFGNYKDRRRIFKNGQFVYPESDAFQTAIVTQLDDWEALFRNIKLKRSFLMALILLNRCEEYDHNRMIKKVKEKLKHREIDLTLTSCENIIILLNEIYNDGLSKNLVYFPRSPRKRFTKNKIILKKS